MASDRYSFKNLELWKSAQKLAVDVCRSATSVPANIAEGQGGYDASAMILPTPRFASLAVCSASVLLKDAWGTHPHPRQGAPRPHPASLPLSKVTVGGL
jgi:hypothetical protein